MMRESKKWIVTTSGDRPLSDVMKDLEEIGFASDQVLDEIGCITGTASDDIAKRARAISGVADVSSDEPVDIGPPDTPVTW
jgi:hypothetical protein